MLRRLILYERLRLAAGIGLVLLVMAPAALGAVNAVAAVGRVDVTGVLCFAGLLLPAAGYLGLRFGRLSATRGLTERLARYGNPDDVLTRIDDELADPDHYALGQVPDGFLSPQPDSLHLTEHWLLRLCPAGSAVVHLPDLAWVYRRITARPAVLSMGRLHHQLTCVLRNGDTWTFDTWSPLRTRQVVEAIVGRRPEVLTGYQGDWVQLAADPDAMWA